jgi:hypothetical protein
MGERCKLYDVETGRAQKLGRYHKDDICGRCARAGFVPEDALPTGGTHPTTSNFLDGASDLCRQCNTRPAVSQIVISKEGEGETENTPLCEECRIRLTALLQEEGWMPYLPPAGEEPNSPPEDLFEELFCASRALLNSAIAKEDLIIPTLAFANRASVFPELQSLRDRFAKIEDSFEVREQFSSDFYRRFKGLVPVSVSDGILVLRRVPLYLDVTTYPGSTVIKEIVIDVFRRSVKPGEVAEHYERLLTRQGLASDKSSEGVFSWGFSDAYLAMRVGPGKQLNEGQVARRSSSGRQLMFPPPQLVGELYESLKGSVNSKRFRGIAYALEGRQSGPVASPDNLIPACVAWYLRERGRISDKRRLVRLINQHLLAPCGKREIGVTSDNAIWRNIEKVAGSIMRVEFALQETWVPRQTSVSETHT